MISILSKAATWSPEQPFGEAFSRVFSSRLCSAQLIWTAVMEMTGRMESVENLSEQRRGFASQQQVSHPSHRPLEIAKAIPTFPQPRRRYSLTNLQTTKPRGHFYWAAEGDISIGP